jgi:hypothetical protein
MNPTTQGHLLFRRYQHSSTPVWLTAIWSPVDLQASVATAIAGVFAIFANKIDKIIGKLEDVDKAKSRGVSCQH